MSPFTSISDFQHVTGDLDKIDLSVDIMPNRSGSARQCIYGKDIAVLMEMVAERVLACGSSAISSYTFSKNLVTSTISSLIGDIEALADTGKFLSGSNTPSDIISTREKSITDAYSSLSVQTTDLPTMTMAGNRLIYSTILSMFSALKLLNRCWLHTTTSPTWDALILANTVTRTNPETGETWTEEYDSQHLNTSSTTYYHEKKTQYGTALVETGEYLTSSSGNAVYPVARSPYQSATDALSFVVKTDTYESYTDSGTTSYSRHVYGLLNSTATTQAAIVSAMRAQFLAFDNLEAAPSPGDWFYYKIFNPTIYPYGAINAHTYADY